MYTIKFETFKKKIKSIIMQDNTYAGLMIDLIDSPINAADALILSLTNKKDWRTNLIELRRGACAIIDKWDVRRVGALIEMFPNIISKRYRNRPINIEMTDEEDYDYIISIN